MGAVVDIDKMKVGAKGSGRHWTKEEVEKREAAAQKVKPRKRLALKMPDGLDSASAEVWKKVVRDMKQYDIIEKIDEDILASYCEMVARRKEASVKAIEEGFIVPNNKGEPMINPTVKIVQSYDRIILAYSDKLGISAHSRARLAKQISMEKEDENAELFD